MTLNIQIWQTQFFLLFDPRKSKIYLQGLNFVKRQILLFCSPKKGKAKSWMGYCGFEWSNTTLSLEEIPTWPRWKWITRFDQIFARGSKTQIEIWRVQIITNWIELMVSWWLFELGKWYHDGWEKSSLKILLVAARSSIIIGQAQIVKEFSQPFFSIPLLQPTSTQRWLQTFQRGRQDI